MRHATIAPGRLNAPPHTPLAEEELFVVLDGDGTLCSTTSTAPSTDEIAVRAGPRRRAPRRARASPTPSAAATAA